MFSNLNTYAIYKLRNEFKTINNNAFEDSKDFNVFYDPFFDINDSFDYIFPLNPSPGLEITKPKLFKIIKYNKK
jgi:hypothetical protein